MTFYVEHIQFSKQSIYLEFYLHKYYAHMSQNIHITITYQ